MWIFNKRQPMVTGCLSGSFEHVLFRNIINDRSSIVLRSIWISHERGFQYYVKWKIYNRKEITLNTSGSPYLEFSNTAITRFSPLFSSWPFPLPLWSSSLYYPWCSPSWVITCFLFLFALWQAAQSLLFIPSSFCWNQNDFPKLNDKLFLSHLCCLVCWQLLPLNTTHPIVALI